MRLDLHLHTSCSDGMLAPRDVVAEARRVSLDVIAVTDHDTLAGVGPAQAVAEASGGRIRVLAGIELTCTYRGADLHLLGYGFDVRHPALLAAAGAVAQRRRGRVAEICGKLNALGVAITVDDVAVPEGNATVGRPHVAQALVKLGRVASVQEAFTRWLADGGPACVPGCGPDVRDGIAAIAAAGGVSVWAHPALADARRFGELAAMGLGGVEALRPQMPPVESASVEHAARAAGLFITGGSDWHGGPRPALGGWYVTEKHVGAFIERIGLAAAPRESGT